MNIYLVNKSTVIKDDQIRALVPALLQYSRDIRSWWGTMQPGIIFGAPATAKAWQIVFADDSDVQGALGYHEFTPDGRPISYVFAKTAKTYGYDWQITTTHELAEMLMDPWIMRAEQTGNARFHALELCDPVEKESFAYTITAGGYPPVRVSDFVTPNWFVPGSTGKFDHRGYCTAPLQILDGGYAYYWENGQWYSEDAFGHKLTPAEFAEKEPGKQRLALYARDRGE